MKSILQLLLLITLFSNPVLATPSPHWQLNGIEEGWNSEYLTLQYFHHSELQRQWAWHLLGRHSFSGNEDILDFGCGDGKITAEISHLIPQGHISGVDLSPFMIAFAQRCFPSAYYPNLTFTQSDIDFNQNTSDKYDLICSFCVFHLVSHPIPVLCHLQKHLRDNGKILLVIPAGKNPVFFQAANEIFAKYQLPAPWSSQDKEVSPMRTKEGCVRCLAAAGLEPISITQIDTPTPFFNKQELMEWMLGTVTANWHILQEKSKSFCCDLVDRMIEIDDTIVDSSGACHMKLSRLEVIAKSHN